MKPETLWTIGHSCMVVLVVAVWAFVLWMACHVSSIILQSLDMIVQLAAITE